MLAPPAGVPAHLCAFSMKSGVSILSLGLVLPQVRLEKYT